MAYAIFLTRILAYQTVLDMVKDAAGIHFDGGRGVNDAKN